MFFSRIPFCLLHLSTCLTGWVYDQELGLYWLNRVEALLLNEIPCGSLICTASVDFICWNCAFAKFFKITTLQAFRFGLSFSCKLTLCFIWPVCLRFYVLFSLFGDTIQLFDSYRILKEEEELLAVWLYHVQLYVGLVLTVSII